MRMSTLETVSQNSKPDAIELVEETRRALQGLRSALIELYGAIEADPQARQDVVRRFGLNKNLSWKLSRVISAPDAFASLNHLPGQQGLHVALDAFKNAGAPPGVLSRAHAAVERFGEVVASHADDREHLELTLESMGLFEREAAAAGGRELAYRGNSMIWGVQARTRVALTFLGPSREGPDMADSITAYGFVGVRRLRANARWRLFDQGLTDDAGEVPQFTFRVEPLDPGTDGNPMSMLPEFCSANAPALEVSQSRALREFWLPAGQVGNKASFDLFRGHITRNVPLYQSPGSKVGFYAASITLPVHDLVFDYIVHRGHRPADPRRQSLWRTSGSTGQPEHADSREPTPNHGAADGTCGVAARAGNPAGARHQPHRGTRVRTDGVEAR